MPQRRYRRRRRRKMSPKRYQRFLNFLARRKMRRTIRRNNYEFIPRRRRQQQSQVVPRATTKSRFTSVPIENNGLRVSGYDMVYDMTQTEVDNTSGAFVSIPANPAYWTGTRIAQLASAYSQYRPIYLRFDYFPAVSMQDSGTVTSGTIWNEAPSTNSLSQALTTSNAGKTHTVWTKTKSRIRVGTNLDQNLYDMSGTFDDDTNPFIFLAVVNDSEKNRVPGYYMCQYTFELKNPIGDGNEYMHEIKSAGELQPEDVWESTSGVLRSESAGFSPGTIVTVQVIAGVVQFLLKGSRLGVAADLVFDLFKNRNKRIAQALESQTENYIYTYNSGVANPTHPAYSVSNSNEPITREMFVKGNTAGVSSPFSGWLFKFENRNGFTLLIPKYVRNYTWQDYDFDDPTDASTILWNVLTGWENNSITHSIISTTNNSQAQNIYQVVSDSYLDMSGTDGGYEKRLLIDLNEIIVNFPEDEDNMVGSGNLVMK